VFVNQNQNVISETAESS